mmetsp:Transcript_68424/g.198206  ORF Transcript_68424/g.198206 Transcript_68424/m.198206 type:complete len:239 (-) Transcript_68424:1108-1824(-)
MAAVAVAASIPHGCGPLFELEAQRLALAGGKLLRLVEASQNPLGLARAAWEAQIYLRHLAPGLCARVLDTHPHRDAAVRNARLLGPLVLEGRVTETMPEGKGDRLAEQVPVAHEEAIRERASLRWADVLQVRLHRREGDHELPGGVGIAEQHIGHGVTSRLPSHEGAHNGLRVLGEIGEDGSCAHRHDDQRDLRAARVPPRQVHEELVLVEVQAGTVPSLPRADAAASDRGVDGAALE